MFRDNPSIFLYLWNGFSEQISTIGERSERYDEETVPHQIHAIVPLRCSKCSFVSLWDDFLAEYEQEGKTKGVKILFQMASEFTCGRCGEEMEAFLVVSHYDGMFSFEDSGCKGCKLIEIQGLDEIIEGLEAEKLHLLFLLDELDAKREDMIREVEYLSQLAQNDPRSPKYVLITEGKDDVHIWRSLLQNVGVEPDTKDVRILHGIRSGGLDEAIATFELVRKMQLLCKVRLVVDSDNQKSEAIKKMKKYNIRPFNYHILERKEIESYLFDSETISAITGIPKTTIEEQMRRIGTTGKNELSQLFQSLSMIPPDEQLKYLIAKRLTKIPKELEAILEEIREHSP